jgi:hypothetical protein
MLSPGCCNSLLIWNSNAISTKDRGVVTTIVSRQRLPERRPPVGLRQWRQGRRQIANGSGSRCEDWSEGLNWLKGSVTLALQSDTIRILQSTNLYYWWQSDMWKICSTYY